MNRKIRTVLAFGLVAAFASPAFAALDVEANPVASGRYIAGTPGPVPARIMVARADTMKHAHPSADWSQFDRAVGGIR